MVPQKKGGSFYLQSKVVRAKERLEVEHAELAAESSRREQMVAEATRKAAEAAAKAEAEKANAAAEPDAKDKDKKV